MVQRRFRDDGPSAIRAYEVIPAVGLAQANRFRHTWHELVLILNGQYRVEVEGHHWRGAPGDAFIYPAGAYHDASSPQDGSTRILVLAWHDPPPPGDGHTPFRVHDRDARLISALVWLRRDLDDGYRGAAAHLVEAILAEVARLGAPGTGQLAADPVRETQRLIAANLALLWPLDRLAQAVGLSRSQLVRRFRAACGMAPAAYQRKLRLDRTLHLLVSTHLSLREIAGQVGYRSPFHLSTSCRKAFGRSPEQIRQDRSIPTSNAV